MSRSNPPGPPGGETHERAPTDASTVSIEAVTAGTLVLMSHYARSPCLAAADKIARNLALMARHPGASDSLQTVCSRLFVEWLGPLQTQDEPSAHHWRTVLPMPEGTH